VIEEDNRHRYDYIDGKKGSMASNRLSYQKRKILRQRHIEQPARPKNGFTGGSREVPTGREILTVVKNPVNIRTSIPKSREHEQEIFRLLNP
jgi:hypothetical protein